MSSLADRDPVADAAAMGRSAQVVASALVAARFLPIWLAMAVLLVVAALFAPSTLENTSWSYILPFMTILAIAALGQMLVVMQAGIDLSTAGTISLCANVLVGVSVGSNHGLAVGMLVCVGLGALVGLVNGVLVGIVRLNPLIVTLAVGQIVLAYSSKYARENTVSLQVPESLSSWAAEKPLGISAVFWTGAAIAIAVALVLRYTTAGRRFQAVGANPRAAWMAGLRVRTHVVFAYTAAGVLYAVAAILLAGVRISIDSGFGAAYLLAPIAAVVLAGAALSGGLASATSTWMAALALTFLTEMLLIFGLSAALQFIVFGAAIIVGMLVSGDRVASLLGRVLRMIETRSGGGKRTRSQRDHQLRQAGKGGTMEGRNESEVPRKRSRNAGVLALLVLGAALALALVSASSGGTGSKQINAAKPPAVIATGKGFGEVYAAKTSTLKHTLFKATLLPKDKVSRNIALAGLGRADRKVNLALALRCWKNNGCSTGTGGKLTVAYHRAVRRERLPPDVEDGVHPPGADVSAGRQDHLLERTRGLHQGVRRLESGDRPGCRPDRHLSGLRRRHDPGDEGGDRRRNPGCDVCLGLRQRSRQELPDGRR